MIPDALARAPLACPLDGLELEPGPDGLRCRAGHNHGVARRGYADLLPVHHKRSRAPGDDAAMVGHRRRVLDSGLYDPIADALVRAARSALAPGIVPGGALVDAGCGEGAYTVRLRAALDIDACAHVIGCDVSKPAIAAAARRGGSVAWALANNVRLPLAAGAASLITSVFGFEAWAPWATLQRPGQRVITVSPGAHHLVELRELVYDEVRYRESPPPVRAREVGYALDDELHVRVRRTLDAPGLAAAALGMTPHAHRGGARVAPDSLDALTELTLDVVVRTWTRNGAPDGPLD